MRFGTFYTCIIEKTALSPEYFELAYQFVRLGFLEFFFTYLQNEIIKFRFIIAARNDNLILPYLWSVLMPSAEATLVGLMHILKVSAG